MSTETELLEQILQSLKAQNKDDRLWDASDIMEYTKTGKTTVYERIICKPDFPQAIRIPTGRGNGIARWYPEEVKEWFKKFRCEGGKAKAGRKRAA